jgi:lysozyme
MKLSPQWLDQLKAFEGCRLDAYADEAGVWTIGYGDTHQVKRGDTQTPAQCEARLRVLVEDFESGVERAITRPVTQPQFDALVTLAYNIGLAAFRSSTLLKHFIAGDVQAAARDFGSWVNVTRDGHKVVSPNLMKRRFAEVVRFLS